MYTVMEHARHHGVQETGTSHADQAQVQARWKRQKTAALTGNNNAIKEGLASHKHWYS